VVALFSERRQDPPWSRSAAADAVYRVLPRETGAARCVRGAAQEQRWWQCGSGAALVGHSVAAWSLEGRPRADRGPPAGPNKLGTRYFAGVRLAPCGPARSGGDCTVATARGEPSHILLLGFFVKRSSSDRRHPPCAVGVYTPKGESRARSGPHATPPWGLHGPVGWAGQTDSS
jgi:hypothetical protein